MTETEFYRDALSRIATACSNPFGKDARVARRIAIDALRYYQSDSTKVNRADSSSENTLKSEI